MVKSYYSLTFGRVRILFPFEVIWELGAPKKVAFFVWMIALDSFLTIDKLKKKGYRLTNHFISVVLLMLERGNNK